MANNTIQNQYDIPQGGYVTFDALSLRQIIIDRLNEQGTFTDQNFVGSNLASIIDIIAYSFNTLMYYLNKTSTESMFSEAQLYENINRIVKLLDYKPIGFQTSTLSFNASATNLGPGLYTIPRYSYVKANNITFSFKEDITFAKNSLSLTAPEPLTTLSQETFLYQGSFQEYPTYTAAGDNNEILIVDTAGQLVDHFSIDVYVYSQILGKWAQYQATENLYLENGNALKYQIRLNENQRYEITFGNDINGKKLQAGDFVAVYYLQSDGVGGVVGPNALKSTDNSTAVTRYNSVQYNSILNDTVKDQYNFLTSSAISTALVFNNTTSSTTITPSQNVDEIRSLAPANFRSQYRLITSQDYITFIKTNFANLVSDIQVVNNTDYTSQYLKYFYSLGVNAPTLTDRALINQVLYADACNFNNIYIIAVPRSTGITFNYLTPAQKQLIKYSIESSKAITTETTFIDPVYKAVAIGISTPGKTIYPPGDTSCIQLQVIRAPNTSRNSQAIINDISNIFKNYFNQNNLSLGQTLDITGLTQQILAVDGVSNFYTARTDVANVKVEGLSVYVWNPSYPYTDATVTTNNVSLNYFEFPFYNNLSNIGSYITVTN
jgi:hypothetical protein